MHIQTHTSIHTNSTSTCPCRSIFTSTQIPYIWILCGCDMGSVWMWDLCHMWRWTWVWRIMWMPIHVYVELWLWIWILCGCDMGSVWMCGCGTCVTCGGGHWFVEHVNAYPCLCRNIIVDMGFVWMWRWICMDMWMWNLCGWRCGFVCACGCQSISELVHVSIASARVRLWCIFCTCINFLTGGCILVWQLKGHCTTKHEEVTKAADCYESSLTNMHKL